MITKEQFTVTGMSCAGCVAHVQKSIEKVAGVRKAEVSLLEGRTLVTYDTEQTSPEALKSAVDALGYKMLIGAAKEREQRRISMERGHIRTLTHKLILSALLTVAMMLLHMYHSPLGLSLHTALILSALASTEIYFYVARDYHSRTLKQLRHGSFTMDTLISMSITVAYIFSWGHLFTHNNEVASSVFQSSYFDVVGMIVTFVLLGKLLEEKAKVRTNDALRKLIQLAPETAWVLRNGDEWAEVPVQEIVVGDTLRLRKGDRVPVDGRLLDRGVLDESSITGEPLPVDKSAGDTLLSGSICVGDTVRVVAERVGDETLLARIIQTVRSAQASKAPIQRIADTVSSYFVPAILLIALATFGFWAWGYSEGSYYHALYFSVSVLVIACPCALGLATPTAITVGIGRASRYGLLIRDAVVLEQMGKVTDVVFDKTGTLTHGTPSIVDEEWKGERDQLLDLLVSAEQHSSHPLAKAFMHKYGAQASGSYAADEVSEEIGQGLFFTHAGHLYRIGKREWVGMGESPLSVFETTHAEASLIYMTRDGECVATFAIEEEIAPQTQEAMRQLEQMGVRVHLLSGDRQQRAEKIGNAVGIRHIVGGVSPLGKQEYIQQLKQGKGRVVAMVGDGINDTPALASADVSIAMGTGSDIATDVAMVTVIQGSPLSVVQGIALSRQTVRTIHQNFFWAFIYNLAAVPVAAGLFAPTITISPMWAAAAMAMSSVSVVSNSLRLKWAKIPH